MNQDFRGRGVGTALMAAAEAKGKESGFNRISLLVSKGKGRAQALYERLGYKTVRAVTMGDVEYARMVKELTA